MVHRNESHPVCCRINITWKPKNNSIRSKFENRIKNSCNEKIDEEQKKQDKAEFCYGHSIETDFLKQIDLVATFGTTRKTSYIFKDDCGKNPLHTKLTLFNDREHIVRHINDVHQLLKTVLKEECGWFVRALCWAKIKKIYDVEFNYSIASIPFKEQSYREIFFEKKLTLIGFLIAPLMHYVFTVSDTVKNLKVSVPSESIPQNTSNIITGHTIEVSKEVFTDKTFTTFLSQIWGAIREIGIFQYLVIVVLVLGTYSYIIYQTKQGESHVIKLRKK